MSEQTGKLAEALAKIAGECGVVLKTGDNTHQRYTYASDADLKRQLQPLYAKHGVSIVPRVVSATWDDVKQRNGVASRCRMLVSYTVAHKSGETMIAESYGEGISNGDKAAYVAQTGAYKYLVRTIFAVPTTDDAEEVRPVAVAHATAGTGHDAEFTEAAKKKFGADLGELGATYDDVKDWRLDAGSAKPSTIGTKGRKRLIEYMRTTAGKADFLAFLGSR